MSVYSDYKAGAIKPDEYQDMLRDEAWLDCVRGSRDELPDEYDVDDEEEDEDGE